MRHFKKAALFFLLTIIMVAWGPGESRALGPEPYPAGEVKFETYPWEEGVIKPGEVTTYIGQWNGIEAAMATLTVNNDPKRPGFVCARAEGGIVGSVSLLYSAEDSLGGCMDGKTMKPDVYEVHIKETLDNYDMTLKFDHAKREAHRRKTSGGKVTEKHFRFKNAYSPVSAFLFIRGLPWKTGDKRGFEVIDGNDRYLLVVKAGEIRNVTVRAGTFKSIRIIPSLFELPSDGRPETAKWWERQKRKDQDRISLIKSFELWMAVDGARPFVKGRADLYFGHVDLELASIKPGA